MSCCSPERDKCNQILNIVVDLDYDPVLDEFKKSAVTWDTIRSMRYVLFIFTCILLLSNIFLNNVISSDNKSKGIILLLSTSLTVISAVIFICLVIACIIIDIEVSNLCVIVTDSNRTLEDKFYSICRTMIRLKRNKYITLLCALRYNYISWFYLYKDKLRVEYYLKPGKLRSLEFPVNWLCPKEDAYSVVVRTNRIDVIADPDSVPIKYMQIYNVKLLLHRTCVKMSEWFG